MTTPNDEPANTADLRGPGDPDEAKDKTGHEAGAPHSGQHPDLLNAANIREEQQAHAAGTVPASYVGSGGTGQDAGQGPGTGGNGEGQQPEEALTEPGTWDDDV